MLRKIIPLFSCFCVLACSEQNTSKEVTLGRGDSLKLRTEQGELICEVKSYLNGYRIVIPDRGDEMETTVDKSEDGSSVELIAVFKEEGSTGEPIAIAIGAGGEVEINGKQAKE